MENFYTTQNGLKLLTDWSISDAVGEPWTTNSGAAYAAREWIAEAAARRLYWGLEFTHGEKPRTPSDFWQALPYTSSGEFAAVWSGCNFEAVKRGTRQRLAGIAFTVDGLAVAYWKECDENGDEVRDVFEVIR